MTKIKKKLLFGALAALFLSGGVLTAMSLSKKDLMSDLTLANIEAMSQDLIESENEGKECHWEYIRNKTSGCLVGGKANICECGATTQPL